MEEKLLTVAEVAEYFRAAPKTVVAWIKAGKLPAVKVCKRYLIRQSDLALIMQEQ